MSAAMQQLKALAERFRSFISACHIRYPRTWVYGNKGTAAVPQAHALKPLGCFHPCSSLAACHLKPDISGLQWSAGGMSPTKQASEHNCPVQHGLSSLASRGLSMNSWAGHQWNGQLQEQTPMCWMCRSMTTTSSGLDPVHLGYERLCLSLAPGSQRHVLHLTCRQVLCSQGTARHCDGALSREGARLIPHRGCFDLSCNGLFENMLPV